MTAALLLSLAGCREQIIHNLDENEANRMIARLHDGHVDAEKTKQADGKWSVSVDKKNALSAIKHLSDARLLRNEGTGAKDRPMITSREEQKFRYERSLSGEIENSLASMAGVLEARVHLNLPEVDPILGNRLAASRGSGSVLLIASRDFDLPPDEIKSLVGGAAGIPRESIVVLFSRETIAAPAVIAPVTGDAAALTGREFAFAAATALAVFLGGGLLCWSAKRRRALRTKLDLRGGSEGCRNDLEANFVM